MTVYIRVYSLLYQYINIMIYTPSGLPLLGALTEGGRCECGADWQATHYQQCSHHHQLWPGHQAGERAGTEEARCHHSGERADTLSFTRDWFFWQPMYTCRMSHISWRTSRPIDARPYCLWSRYVYPSLYAASTHYVQTSMQSLNMYVRKYTL